MSTVRCELDGPLAIVTIDRPAVRNAVDGPTAALLADAFRRFDADPTLDGRDPHRRRRHVLRGRGSEGDRPTGERQSRGDATATARWDRRACCWRSR